MTASRERKPVYGNRVFINCPFDDEYRPLFRALVFTVEYCGFSARCALEVEDSGETRAEKIIRLIRDSRFGIHDISRTQPNLVDGEPLPRSNMPYELGLFLGFKSAGPGRQRNKKALVLDREKYRYQKFLSDIAGQDIRSHRDDPAAVIAEVRGWLQAQTPERDLVGAAHLVSEFARFGRQVPALLARLRKTEADLGNYPDFHKLVNGWIRETAGPAARAG